MTVYLINIFLILLMGFLCIYIEPNQRKRAIFCGFSALNWILISGLRGLSVGADTPGYARSFQYAGSVSWKTVLYSCYQVYLRGYTPQSPAENALYKDPGYLVFQKFIHIFTDNYQVYLFLVAIILFASLAYFVYKNSEDPCFSFILFSTLFYSFYAITGIRQTLATALVVFIGYEFIKERKFWPFVLVSVLAYTLHKSALVFIPFYFISRKKVTWKYAALLCGIVLVLFAIGPNAILALSDFFGYDRDEVYSAPTYTYSAMMLLVGCGTLLVHKRLLKVNANKNIELSAVVLATALTMLTFIDQSMMRVQQYYSLFMMLTIPSMIGLIKEKVKIPITFGCMAVLIVLFMLNHPHYEFFWQA
ncbi:MAG: EpsG family protein [Candidatus Fimenecus sp.]